LFPPTTPIRIVCIIAKWAADAFGKESLYDELIKINHYPHFDQRQDSVYSETADDVIDKSKDICVIPLLNNTVASLQALLHATTFSGFPVVTSLSEMHIVGFMSRSNMEAVLQQALEECVPASAFNNFRR
jgi:chloride channel 3/4/5